MMSSTRMPQLPVRSSISRSATATFHSAVRAWPSSSMVRATTAAPCSLHERHDPGEARVGPVAVLEVDRVDDGAAAEHLQAGLDDRRLGRVEHQRQRRRGGEPAGDLAHVGDAVAADVVHAHVEQVRAVAGLVARDLDAVVPALGEHRLAERLGAVGVGPLADRQVRRCPAGTARLVQRGHAGLRARAGAARSSRPRDALDQPAQVLRRRAAAAADQREAVLAGERVVRVGQLVRA